MEFKQKYITPYSTYLLSRDSKELPVKVICENSECKKEFRTNIGRKRCCKKCAVKSRKENKKLLKQATEL